MVLEAENTIENVINLQKMVDDLLQKEKSYKSEIKILNEQIKYLQDQLFGRKSEKKPVESNQVQLSLFEMPEEEFPIGDQLEKDEEIDIPAHKRKKRGRRPIPDNLPVIDVVHDIDEAEKVCECGCLKERIGEETSKQLDIIPAKIQVIKHIRPKYACKHCEGVESEGPTVTIAPMPEQVIPKCIGTSGLIAYVLVAKFVDALPFYRQEKQFLRIGVEISRASMCNWARKVAESCEILLMMLKNEILSGPLINIDETPTQVFNKPNKSNTTKSYMWVFRGGIPEHSGILFEYHPSRYRDVPAAFLNGYQGVVQTDGYSAYSFLDAVQGILHMACWTHARRKFMDVVKAAGKPKGKKKTGKAGKALSYIRKLYKIEKDAKSIGLTGDALLQERQEKAKPVLDEFKKWLDVTVEITPPQSLLGKAVNYALNQWHRLVVYVDLAYVTLDNNMAENTIRPFVIGRKNWLFSVTPEGAAASAALYSLIETAKANGLEPYWYFRYLLEKLPDAMTEDDYKALLPQYLDKTKLAGPPSIS
ncbi:IS66 family transposase [Desulfobacter hydrogenophilus]|uniref:IS66 family transposase n=1 Tax=Desulfobacter hydrogenophilus TaxID=2291 RepID=A0A328F5V6_9BACT|nr:IS66 family transposase [Desulfobacter hydrogenophilus]NDY74534.1 IS66 family transposase [Desulfobacter hydrogenophilus]QBH13350.1 IS66 family transposase [Desulfobacter hydrogenophilus]RAL99910.1 IS66 family transposase [Desulfobacter hydrogenophilus]